MEGNEFKFQEIYTEYQPKILRYLAGMAGKDEAEDLTQEVFLKVSQALETFRGESKISTWIYRVATNAAIDRMRSPSYRRMTPMETPDKPGEKCDQEFNDLPDIDVWTGDRKPLVEHQIFHQEMNACLLGFIQELAENDRTVLMLSEYEGLENAEIARILGVNLDTMKIRLHRARQRLKEKLLKGCDSYWIEDNKFLPELRLA